jgi:Zn-dependent protease
MNTGLKVFGIPIYIGIGGIFLVALLLWDFGSVVGTELQMDGTSKFICATILMLTVVLSIFLHEVGHAFSHKRFGGEVTRIQITFFGGVAYLNSVGRSPLERIVTSAAGPAVNIALLIGLLPFMGNLEHNPNANFIVHELVRINLILAVFNLIPIPPLDGGHIAQAIIWGITGNQEKGEEVCNNAGKVISYGLIILTLLSSLIPTIEPYGNYLALLGIFGFNGCSQGRKSLRLRIAARSLTAKDACKGVSVIDSNEKITDEFFLLPKDGVIEMSSRNTGIFLVTDNNDSIVGTREPLLLTKADLGRTISEVMGPVPELISPDLSLETLMEMAIGKTNETVYLVEESTQSFRGLTSLPRLSRKAKELSMPDKTGGLLSRIMAFGE